MDQDSLALTPIAALLWQAEQRPDFVMMVQGNDAWTYRRFVNEVQCLSRGLLAHRVKPGDRIVLQLGHCPAAAVALYAGMLIGAIVVPMNTHYARGEVERLLRRLRPTAYLCHGDTFDLLADVETSFLPANSRFVVDGVTPEGARSWLELFEANTRELPPVAPFEGIDAPALLSSTSGSTGEPKLVVHTQRTIAGMIRLNVERGIDNGTSVTLASTPLFHIPGSHGLMRCATLGRRLVLPDCRDFDPDAYLDAIEAHLCTQLMASPYGVTELLKCQRSRPRSLTSMRSWTVGGDFCRPGLQNEFELVFRKKLQAILGMSEAPASFGPGGTPQSSRGRPGNYRIVDQNGADVTTGTPGELLVRGENLFKGYWHAPGVIHDATEKGWYGTGDILYQDDHGDLWYVTRKKEIIVRDGENIAPLEVEQALLSHHAAADAAVIGVSDPALGQRIIGFIKLSATAQQVTLVEILDDLSVKLASYKIPEVLFVLDEIPRNVFGKADRRKLIALAANHFGEL